MRCVVLDLALQLVNSNRSAISAGYPVEVKDFAQKMRYHSAAAYDILRQHFTLPAVSTLQRWTSSVDASPGYTIYSFLSLEQLCRRSQATVLCSLVCDGIGLKMHISYDRQKDQFNGYVRSALFMLRVLSDTLMR